MRETEGESTGAAVQGTPSLDLIFDILSNRRRRYVLYHLHEQPDGVATIDEITDAVVSCQYATTSTDADETAAAEGADSEPDLEQRRLRIQTELQHTHLPKLEDAGVVEYDHRSEAVRYWTQPSLEEWLEHAKHKERL